MTERTFSILKPDATERNLTGKINAVIEDAGLRIVAQRRVRLSDAQAKKFYEVHAERPFYGELVAAGQPVMSASVKNWAISIFAFSWLSEPWTEFSPTLSA